MVQSIKHYYRINRSDIARLRFLVEAYEGLALVSTVDAVKGLVCLRASADNSADYRMMMRGLRAHFPIEAIDPRQWGIEKENVP